MWRCDRGCCHNSNMARAAMVWAVFPASDRTTVRMKDHTSGPEGFLPFVRAVPGSYEPRDLLNAIVRAGRPGSGAE